MSMREVHQAMFDIHYELSLIPIVHFGRWLVRCHFRNDLFLHEELANEFADFSPMFHVHSNLHWLEKKRSLSLSLDPKGNFNRSTIFQLFRNSNASLNERLKLIIIGKIFRFDFLE